MKLRVVLEPSDEGGFTALVPALPGCISDGNTREEALANIREAILLYLEPVEGDDVIGPGAAVVEVVELGRRLGRQRLRGSPVSHPCTGDNLSGR